MSGQSDFKIQITYGELNNIYDKLTEVNTFDNEYLALDYEHLQIVRILLALKEYLDERNIEPQFEINLEIEDE